MLQTPLSHAGTLTTRTMRGTMPRTLGSTVYWRKSKCFGVKIRDWIGNQENGKCPEKGMQRQKQNSK